MPATYADAFRLLAADDVIDDELANRLARAAGFRNIVVHTYADLDMDQVYTAATRGPDDIRAFLAAAETAIQSD